MIKSCLKNSNGITMISLVIAIGIMIIISSVLIYNTNIGLSTRALNNMYSDIELLKDKISIYYSSYNALPTLKKLYTNVNNISNTNENDNEEYYVIDLEALDNVTLNYGKGYENLKNNQEAVEEDVYVVNEKSHSIYYIKGIKLDNKTYYTIPGEYTKIELPEVAKIEAKISNNTSTITINALSKSEGIKEVNLYVGNKLYKKFSYTDNLYELKKENIEITQMLFNEKLECYIELINKKGNKTKSEVISIINEDTIETADDLKKIAEVVNTGITFENKTINVINDIDLSTICGEKIGNWIPIGTDKISFLGTFNGNNHKINNIYINNTNSCQGLFGSNKGIIRDLTVSGNITAGAYSGAIAGFNDKIITRCQSNVIIKSNSIGIGGIVGRNLDNGIVEKCYNTSTITSSGQDSYNHSFVGGIVGLNNGIIEESYNLGDISGIQTIGGITGGNYEGATQDCYNAGNISGTKANIGGIVGFLHLQTVNKLGYTIIKNCYNIGNITTTITTTGAIAGINDTKEKSIFNSYYLTSTAIGGVNSADVIGSAEVKTDVELKNISNVLGDAFKADINNINNGYPILLWQ